LARLKVDVIVASINTTITPAKQATTTIPIVMVFSADPIGQGYIASLARPGGNITGLAWDPAPEFFGKFVEFLMQVIPGLSRLAGIVDAMFPATRPYWMATEAAARSRNMVLRRYDVQTSSSFPDVLRAIERDRAEAVIVFLGPFLYGHRREIAELAVKHRLPSVFNYREGPESGGLMSYGPDLLDAWRRAACPSPKPRPTRSRNPRSFHGSKTTSLVEKGYRATGILRPSTGHGQTGFGVEDGKRKGRSGAVACAFGGRPAVLDYAARRT
jgi:putative ABC transport system substrate-binding protein